MDAFASKTSKKLAEFERLAPRPPAHCLRRAQSLTRLGAESTIFSAP